MDNLELTKPAIRPLAWTALVYLVASFGSGVVQAFSVIGLGFYRDPQLSHAKFHIQDSQVPWFVSVLALSNTAGTLVAGKLTPLLGCRMTILASCIVVLMGWPSLALSDSFLVVLLSRALQGIAMGICMPATMVVLSDVAPAMYRGMLSSGLVTAMCSGFIIGLCAGSVNDIRIVVTVFAMPQIFFCVANFSVPDSPVWLLMNGRVDDTRKALLYLRGPLYPIDTELRQLAACVENKGQEKASDEEPSLLDKIVPVLKPMGITCFLMMTNSLVGSDALSFYCIELFPSIKMPCSTYVLSILFQVFILIGYFASSTLIDRVPRRKLAIMSCIGLTLGLLSASAAASLELASSSSESDSSSASLFGWLLCFSILATAFSYSVGFSPVVYALSTELFPPRLRAFGSACCMVFRSVVSFVHLSTYPELIMNIGPAFVLLLHASVAITAGLFFIKFVPETKGLTNEQMANLFAKGKKIRKETAIRC